MFELPNEVESSEQRFARIGLRSKVSDTAVTDSDQHKDKENSGSEYAPSIIAPSTTVSTRKSPLMNEEDIVKFRALFNDLIHSKKPIKRDFVREQIEKSSALKHLLDKCSIVQLADKVRTERKIVERG